jgi:hypothetical protein
MSEFAFSGPTYEANGHVTYQEGMTLREYFAGQAIAGLLAGMYQNGGGNNLCEAPKEAVLIADALIIELAKK